MVRTIFIWTPSPTNFKMLVIPTMKADAAGHGLSWAGVESRAFIT